MNPDILLELRVPSKMVTAVDRVVHTPEIFEQILLALPLVELLKARQVSRLCRELILNSSTIRTIQSHPHIRINLRLPTHCSLSEGAAPILAADLTLYFDKPLTLCKFPYLSSGPSQVTYKFEEGTSPPTSFGYYEFGARFNRNAMEFSRTNEAKWLTLLPGVPHCMLWNFRPISHSFGRTPYLGNLSHTEIGKVYLLRLRPNYRLAGFIGAKESLFAKLERGEDMAAHKLGGNVPLVGENEVCFTVVS